MDSDLDTRANSVLQSDLRKAPPRTDNAQPAHAAIRVLGIALVAAVPLELLLRVVPGLNIVLAATLVGASLLVATARTGAEMRVRVALAAVLVALAFVFAWRGESLLWLASVVGILVTGTFMLFPGTRWLWDGDPFESAVRALVGVFQTTAGPLRLLQGDIDWSDARLRGPKALGHLRGFALSVAVVLPFLLLFAEADAVFAAHSRELVDLPRLASHVVLWGVLAWLMTGWLGAALLPWARRLEARARVSSREATWVLAVLSLAFASFVAVQVRYFFGGEELVAQVTGLTYAEYARRGFFELVAVAALLLGVLLLADFLTRDADRAGQRRVRWLSALLLALLGVILVSALQRMQLYVDEYGLTQLRFFTTAFMLWMIVVFGWYCATVLRGARRRFIGGVYVSGVLAVLALAVVDPIARIALFNVERAERTSSFDESHALSLGADAVPVLAASIGRLPLASRCPIAVGLASRWSEPPPVDAGWRSWNRSRQRARDLVRDQLPRFEAMCGSIRTVRETP